MLAKKMIYEEGSAEITVSLSDGIITINHSENDAFVLRQWRARKGDWDLIFKTFDLLQQLSEKIYREEYKEES
jgi:hypothetical protein